MTTTISIGGTEVAYRDFEITVPTSPVDIAPSAEITTNATETVAANDPLEIAIDGTTVFAGYTRSGGTISDLGGVDVTAAHGARDVFEDTVSLSLASPTDEQVLSAALSAAGGGTSLTLSYAGTATSLNNDYDCTDRPVKRVFRDMMDRTGRVWWVDPAGTTVHVESLGGRGTWQAIDTQADRATLQRFDTGNVDTVRNAVTVVGTGEEQVRATEENATSISQYGRRTGNGPYNVAYVTTQSEASAIAEELILTDPQPEGKLLVGTNVGDITQPLANYVVDVRDEGKNLDVDNLVVEQQTIEQGRATLTLGAGTGVSIEEINRQDKSRDDQNEPGSVYGSDRLGDDSVDSDQLVDSSVIEAKLDDLAVSLNKVDFDAIDETKIQDGAVRTPQLFAQAVTAAKIEADTITANEIAAGTITALEIAADTITANQIDTLDLDTNELSIGLDADVGIEFQVGANNWTDMIPTSFGAFCRIGTASRPFAAINGEEIAADNALLSGLDVKTFAGNGILEVEPDGAPSSVAIHNEDDSSGTSTPTISAADQEEGQLGHPSVPWGEIHAGATSSGLNHIQIIESGGTPVIIPDTNDTGNVGISGNYFNGMRSNAYFEESPVPVADAEASVDLSELCECDWYDPPAYVQEGTERKQAEAEGLTADDDGTKSADGVELGTMANYLLEVNKAQQNRIDTLEKRIERLENGQGA